MMQNSKFYTKPEQIVSKDNKQSQMFLGPK